MGQDQGSTSEGSTVVALLSGLFAAVNPSVGETTLDRWGPLFVVSAWLLVLVGFFFGFVAPESLRSEAWGLLSAAAGGYLVHNAYKYVGKNPRPRRRGSRHASAS